MWNLLLASLALISADSGGSLEGTVTDDQGRPVASAVVDIATAAPLIGQGFFCPSCYPDCQKKTQTDANGKFVIRGLSPTLKFSVLVAAPGKKPVLTQHINPLLAPLLVTLTDLPKDIPAHRLVLGKVVDDLGQPVAGALLQCSGVKSAGRRWWGATDVEPAISDADGAFSLILPEGYQAIDVRATADGLAGTEVPLLAPRSEPHKIVIPTGARVTGQLQFEGKPASEVRVAVVQTNRFAGNFFIKAVSATSDAQGRFEFNNLPANQQYAIFSVVGEAPQKLVLTTKKFTVPADHKTRDLGTLTLIPALHLGGKFLLAPDQKISENAKLIVGRDPAWDLISVPIEQDGSFEVLGLPPESYELTLQAKGLKIDPRRLTYQAIEDGGSFGLRLEKSLDNVLIPIAK
jgi:hypothetical protein